MNCIPYIYIRTRAREACGPSSRRNTLQMSRLAIIFFFNFSFSIFSSARRGVGSAHPAPYPVLPSRRCTPRRCTPRRCAPSRCAPRHVVDARAVGASSRGPSGRRAVEPMRQASRVWACIVRRAKRRHGARAPKPRETPEPRNGFT